MNPPSPHRRTTRRTPGAVWVWTALVAGAVALAPGPARGVELTDAQIANRRCENCHAQPQIATMPPAQRRAMVAESAISTGAASAARPGLLVSGDTLAGSTHAGVACTDCHADAQTLPHAQQLGAVSCNAACHTETNASYAGGAHGQAARDGNPDAPGCAACHGGHDTRPSTDPASRTYPLNVIELCAACHEQHTADSPAGHDPRGLMDGYLESVHGQAIRSAGLVVAASCVDCHSAHGVAPASDPTSPVHRANVPETCGQCHVGVAQTYAGSIHGIKLLAGDPGAPVCTDCHTAHTISHADTAAFHRDILSECGQCHDTPNPRTGRSFYDTYRLSYHGQVTDLGSDRGAQCSDCHGAHDIRRVDDPASRLFGQGRIEVCRDCHAGASASFALFAPHADYRDAQQYPLLYYVWLYFMIVIGTTFALFGLHSVLWFGRSVVHRLRHGPPPAPDRTAPGIVRFKRIDRINHAALIVSFFGLTLTGMPLLYADQPWACWVAAGFGGVDAAGVWHRGFAVMLLGNCVVHFAGVVNRCRRLGVRGVLIGPDSMVPNRRDLRDLAAMLRWFGGGPQPSFDRWTYWEKFDYWAEVFGTAVIGGTGALLWLAADAPHWLPGWLPGWVFNLAMIIHGYEALLAVAFIFTIHFFNAHLRPGKFPVDDVMFTGQLPEAEFQHERRSEYERARASGALEVLRAAPPPAWQRCVAVLTGLVAMGIGTTLVVLIVLAGLGVIG